MGVGGGALMHHDVGWRVAREHGLNAMHVCGQGAKLAGAPNTR